jgi:hypothetical protein
MPYKNSLKHILIPIIVAISVLVGVLVHKYFFQTKHAVQSNSAEISKVDVLLRKLL